MLNHCQLSTAPKTCVVSRPRVPAMAGMTARLPLIFGVATCNRNLVGKNSALSLGMVQAKNMNEKLSTSQKSLESTEMCFLDSKHQIHKCYM